MQSIQGIQRYVGKPLITRRSYHHYHLIHVYSSLSFIYLFYRKQSDKACKNFWSALASLNDEQRSKFLRFVWGRSRLPRGGDWERPFRITKRQGGDRQLPVGHTCFFQIELPSYSSVEIARKRLLTAITYGLDGFLLV